MREILFRGKRADNGEWVYGYYVKKRDPLLVGVEYHFIVTQDRDNCGCLLSCVSWYRIISETVGQFTGINDNNGTKIFEGDIVRDEQSGYEYIIKWFQEYACYALADRRGNMVFDAYEIEMFLNDLVVVGNIHDSMEVSK